MAVAVVYFFQFIEVEKQHGEGPAVAIGALRLVFKNIEQAAVVGETGERVADGKMANLLEEPGVIEKRATQRDGVAQDHKRLGENEGSVEQERQDHAAKPPSDRRPKETKRGVREKLKKENAGRRKDSAGKKKSSAENEGNAILSSLKTDEGYGGENKGEKAADDLQVALENGIGLKSNAAEPISSKDHKKK